MHELGIVFHIIESVEEVAAQNNIHRVSGVTLQLGEVSGILHDYLSDCWRWACDKNDLMRGAELAIEEIPAITYCEACGRQYPTGWSMGAPVPIAAAATPILSKAMRP